MFAHLMLRTRKQGNTWGIRPGSPGSPRVMDVGGVSYLAARVGLRVAATITTPTWAQAKE
jgi:hypothetical protein